MKTIESATLIDACGLRELGLYERQKQIIGQ